MSLANDGLFRVGITLFVGLSFEGLPSTLQGTSSLYALA